jgi:hypothetical protein
MPAQIQHRICSTLDRDASIACTNSTHRICSLSSETAQVPAVQFNFESAALFSRDPSFTDTSNHELQKVKESKSNRLAISLLQLAHSSIKTLNQELRSLNLSIGRIEADSEIL